MDWNIIYSVGMILQIVVAMAGGGLCFCWLRVEDKRLAFSDKRFTLVKRISPILLGMLAIGFVLEFCAIRFMS